MEYKYFNKENIAIWIGPIFVVLLTIALLIVQIYIGVIGIVFSIISIFTSYEKYKKKTNEFKEYVDNLDIAIEGFTRNAVFMMPFPIAVLNENNELAWYNSLFKNMIGEKESLVEKKITNLIPEINKEQLENNEIIKFILEFSLKTYEVNKVRTNTHNEKMTMLYFIDNTEKELIFKKYTDEKMVILDIRNDNYEELNSSISSDKRPILFAEIDSIINTYIHKYGGFLKKSENGRYYAVIQKSNLDDIKGDRFSFIDKIRNIKVGNSLPPTFSIGIGVSESDPRQLEKSANAALDIALGRGGDQVVIKTKDTLDYFGGNSQATEKRSKVKARVVAHALSQYILKSTSVFISGHKNPDMDSFGSSLGLWSMIRDQDKKAYIILSEVTPAIKNLYEYAIKKIDGLQRFIITPEESYEKIEPSSLVIITDNHRRNSIEEPRLLDKNSNIVIIDHHRRGSDYIENSILTYEEPSASSASELVTEMIMYMNENVKIDKVVAEGLLAGIMVDTKNFSQQTGIRTFESAALLKENGADSVIVKKLFSDDLDTLRIKSEIISSVEVYKENYILGSYDEENESSTLIASLAADELIGVQNIEASFVMVISKNKIHISGRSSGKVSVQLIMEKLNGGGHRTMAATQLDTTMEEAKILLKKAISEYIEEEK